MSRCLVFCLCPRYRADAGKTPGATATRGASYTAPLTLRFLYSFEAASKAITEFGGFDTWVNNAGGSIYGRIMDIPEEDLHRLFDTNLWGVVNGSKIAVNHLRSKGGALINIGSEASNAPLPLQGVYAASKHAVKGFTDSLRIELEADHLPIAVTLIKLTAI